MKVIDLLNKIANGEEVPKKIRVYDEIYTLDEDSLNYMDEECKNDWLAFIDGSELTTYEVEIIEYKKIEKITNMNCIDAIDSNSYEEYSNKAIALDINTLRHQINKIIDKINKGE